jgi:hypothetical protein
VRSGFRPDVVVFGRRRGGGASGWMSSKFPPGDRLMAVSRSPSEVAMRKSMCKTGLQGRLKIGAD